MAQSGVIRFRGFCSLLRHINFGRSVGRSVSKPVFNTIIIVHCKVVWISDLNKHRFVRFVFVYSIVLVSIGKIYQTLKTVFDHVSKHLEVRQKRPLLVSVFGNVVKHGPSCLICYFKVCFLVISDALVVYL